MGSVWNSGRGISVLDQQMAALVHTSGSCNVFDAEIQTKVPVDIITFNSPGDAAKLDVILRTVCPALSEQGSGPSATLRGNQWEVVIGLDQIGGLTTLEKIKATIGGTRVDVRC